MRIREMRRDDVPALAKLNCIVFRDTEEERAAAVFSNSFMNRVEGSCLVAEDDGEIIGAIIAERKTTFYPNAAGIKSFFVMEGCRGKGIGKALLQKCLFSLKEAGIESVSLAVDPDNKEAISVYENAGFGLFRLKYLKRL